MTATEEKEFTVASSASELRQASREGDDHLVQEILSRYATTPNQDNPHARLLPAVLHASDPLSGNTALHFSCANGHDSIMTILLMHNAPVDATNTSGSTPLHYAALTGQVDIVKRLLDAGAKPVVENKFGRTALDEALGGRHEDVAQVLFQHVEALAEKRDSMPQESEISNTAE